MPATLPGKSPRVPPSGSISHWERVFLIGPPPLQRGMLPIAYKSTQSDLLRVLPLNAPLADLSDQSRISERVSICPPPPPTPLPSPPDHRLDETVYLCLPVEEKQTAGRKLLLSRHTWEFLGRFWLATVGSRMLERRWPLCLIQ